MRHPYHLIEPSPWPLFISLNLLFLLLSAVSYFAGILYSLNNLIFSLIMVLFILFLWLYDITTESLYMGFHSYYVSRGLILGFLFFLLTEIMLFFSLFWSYFHSALNPFTAIWPPIGIDLINPWAIPLLNTFLLLYSGIAITFAHHSYLSSQRKITLNWLSLGIILGLIFFILQIFEYTTSSFDITDSVYGSVFYLLTGFHGAHVVFGILFLSFACFRILKFHSPLLIFNLSVLYWHFVDIIWIGLYILIYYLTY